MNVRPVSQSEAWLGEGQTMQEKSRALRHAWKPLVGPERAARGDVLAAARSFHIKACRAALRLSHRIDARRYDKAITVDHLHSHSIGDIQQES